MAAAGAEQACQAGLCVLLVDMEGCQAVLSCIPWAWLWWTRRVLLAVWGVLGAPAAHVRQVACLVSNYWGTSSLWPLLAC